ncbi:MAG: hypothetical protein KIT58_03010 [Planctomycetota bacterium]|nr:hypothetical protein [Planctomycetota bacterium]
MTQVWCGHEGGGSVSAALIALAGEVAGSRCLLRSLDSTRSGEAIQAALARRGVPSQVEDGAALLEGVDLLRARELGLLCGFDEVWLVPRDRRPPPVTFEVELTSARRLAPEEAAPVLEATGAWLIMGDGGGLNWATTRERVRDVLRAGLERDLGWFAVRQLFHFGVADDATNVFEERIVCFAGTLEEAYRKAEAEADEYSAFHGLVRHPDLEAYEQDGEALIDGYEVWSELFESPLSLEAFFAERYGRWRYRPRDVRPPRPPREA